MLGKTIGDDIDVEWEVPNKRNLVAEVSIHKPEYLLAGGKKKIIAQDLGCKNNIVRCLSARDLGVLNVPS